MLGVKGVTPRKSRPKRRKPKPAEVFAVQLAQEELFFNCEREFKFHPTRKFRFDFAWPSLRMAVEIDGGTWVAGRHTRGAGYARDCEKGNEAILLGWKVFHFTTDMVENGVGIATVKEYLLSDL